jgi:uncharacterized protein YerC
MAKFHSSNKLSNIEKEEYFIQLCYVLSKTKSIVESAKILKDLLTEQEVEMISKRLQIADLLIDGFNYIKIKKALKTSDTTIARVHEWLKLAGDGFHLAKEKLKNYEKRKSKEIAKREISSWRNIKKRYPMYFWPQLILEEVIINLNQKQKKKIRQVINQTKEKTDLYKHLNVLLRD